MYMRLFPRKIDGKMFIFQVNLGMWHIKSIFSENQALFWGYHHTFMGFQGDRWGMTFMFQVNLGMWPLKLIVLENHEPCSEGFNTHLCCFQGDRWENVHFSSKPRHVTLKSIVLEKWALFWGFQHTFMGFQGDRVAKCSFFRVNLGMLTPQINCLGKSNPVLRVFNIHIVGLQGDRWENEPCSDEVGFQHTFMGFSKEIDGKMVHFLSKPRYVTPSNQLVLENHL